MAADFAGTGLTIGPHPMSFHRPALALKGVLRTTHQTGAVTDMGLLLGQWLQLKCRKPKEGAKRPEYWKISAILPVATAYFAGGFCGVAAIAYGSFLWMLLPSGLLFAASAAFVVWRCVQKRRKAQRAALLAETEAQFEASSVQLSTSINRK